MWPFRRKEAAPPERKSASFLLNLVGGRSGLSGAAYDRLSVDGFAECIVAFACITKLANAVASVDVQLYQKKKRKLNKIEDHPLLDLMDRPNKTQSGKDFRRHLVSYHQLSGNAYVHGSGLEGSVIRKAQPQELTLLNPGKVQVEVGETYLACGSLGDP